MKSPPNARMSGRPMAMLTKQASPKYAPVSYHDRRALEGNEGTLGDRISSFTVLGCGEPKLPPFRFRSTDRLPNQEAKIYLYIQFPSLRYPARPSRPKSFRPIRTPA